jgi:hypothetical protein
LRHALTTIALFVQSRQPLRFPSSKTQVASRSSHRTEDAYYRYNQIVKDHPGDLAITVQLSVWTEAAFLCSRVPLVSKQSVLRKAAYVRLAISFVFEVAFFLEVYFAVILSRSAKRQIY